MLKKYFYLSLVYLLGFTSYINAEKFGFAPIFIDDILVLTPYKIKDKGPDLEILNTTLVDENGHQITENNRYEAGDDILVKMSVKNVGDEDITIRDKYYGNITLDTSTSGNRVFIPELMGLSPNKVVTFTYKAGTQVRNKDNGKSISFDINMNKSIFDDKFWEENLFVEKNKTNNSSKVIKIFVYQTDITIQDLNVKVLDRDYNVIRDNNTIDISEDNINGNYAAFCLKVNNIGEHKIKHTFWTDEMVFRTGSIGNWWLIMNSVNIGAHTISNEICITLSLPRTLDAGTYEYVLDASKYNDIDKTNNTSSLTYTIKN